MNDSDLQLWFKDKVLGDVHNTTDYLSQTVNIDVRALLNSQQFSEYVKLVAGDTTDRVYKEVGHTGMDNGSGAYIFYGHLLSLTNKQKLEYMHQTLGD